jgi:asparagine synthase (glutamine-hydrolysing)
VSGFFGIVREDGASVEDRFLQRIADALRFRGPDGVSIWSDGGMGSCFAFMRTGPAPQAAKQPVESQGRFRVWGDIRVDAREELWREISRHGTGLHPSASSEEYFLHAWQTWGPATLEKIIGDFSLALWDANEHTLWCARDLIGARPFYYAHVGPVFCFSNTLDALRCVPEIPCDLDETYVGDFLLEGWSLDQERTVYKEIHRLPAGNVLQFVNGRATVRRFRTLPVEPLLRFKRPEEYVENYLHLLRVAVKDRLPNGPTALYLSGGLDSGAVAAMALQMSDKFNYQQSLKGFTVSWNPLFKDPEPAAAKITAQHLRIAQEIFEEQDFVPIERSERQDGRSPEPVLEPFFARQQRHWRKIAAHSKVVLSGDGGDEILMGRAWPYLRWLWNSGDWAAIISDFGGYLLRHGRLPPLRGGFRARIVRIFRSEKILEPYPEWLNPEFESRANLRERWKEFRNRPVVQQYPVHSKGYTYFNTGFWAGVLEIDDTEWTGANVEHRVPLLDLRVAQFLLRLPPVPWCANKHLMRVAMKGVLPNAIVSRPKTPLAAEPLEEFSRQGGHTNFIAPRDTPETIKRFVNLEEWCETFCGPKGSLSWWNLRPLSLSKWLESH